MKAVLTSALGGYAKENGARLPAPLMDKNGLTDNLRAMWPDNARVLIICSDPDNYAQNDGLRDCFARSFPLSGLGVASVDMCDGRNPGAADDLSMTDVLVLTGGHVPTQNRFLKRLRLRERLRDYDGIILAWSAGSMNCADTVYAGPDLEGEAVDPNYERWITGLGITDINIFPHMQSLRGTYLDGLRLIEDITYDDSVGHDILALNDGSYIIVDSGMTTLYGEAYMLRDRRQTQLCRDGESVSL